MGLLRDILGVVTAVSGAVAIVLTIVVLVAPQEKAPEPPGIQDQAPPSDAAVPPAGAGTTASPGADRRDEPPAPSRSNLADPVGATPAALGTSPDAPQGSRSGPATGEVQTPSPAWETYVVKHGDTPATIARQHLGDASRWTQIAQANPGLDARSLQIGQVLRLPKAATPAAAGGQTATQANRLAAPRGVPAPSAAPLARHRVAQGDSLYGLARRYYGDASRWELIQDANSAGVASGVTELRLGSELIIPALPEASR